MRWTLKNQFLLCRGKGMVTIMDATIEAKLQELLNSGLSGEELLEAWVTVVNNRKDR